MCIIAIKPADKEMFSEELIRRMFRKNPDGAGMMYPRDDGKVYIKKGFMNVESLLKYIDHYDWSDTPVILHFRIGTAGPNNEMNCHPYPVGHKNFTRGSCDLGMAHNGVMYKYNPPRGSSINDTQVFVNTILNGLPKGFQNNDVILKLLEEDIGSSRIAFMDGSGNIRTIGHWYEDDGYLYSNEGYKPPIVTSYSYKPSTTVPRTSKVEVVYEPMKEEEFLKFFEKEDRATFPTLADFYRAIEFLEEESYVLQENELYEYDGYEYYVPEGTVSIERTPVEWDGITDENCW